PDRICKSIAVGQTFTDDLKWKEDVLKKLQELSSELVYSQERQNNKGRTLTLTIKYKDFSQFTRSKTEIDFFDSEKNIFNSSKNLWWARPFDKPVRLLGLSLSNLNTQQKKQISIQLQIPFID